MGMQFFATNRFRCGLFVCFFLLTQAAIAQVELGGVQFQNLNGTLGTGYSGESGVQEQSTHNWGLSGNLNSNGYYYNPGFLSFQAQTYYARAASTADSASLSDSEGYNLGAGIFGGTRFPGYVSFGQNWGQSAAYGLPGLSGLNSTNNNRDFGVSWMFRNLPVKNLSVFFSNSENTTDIPGVGFNTTAGVTGFGVATGGYNVAGFSLAGGYQHSLSNVTTDIAGPEGGTATAHGSSDVFHVMTTRTLPWHSNLTASAYRIMSRSSGEGEKDNSDSDEFDASISSHVWRLPLSATLSYDDNVYGTALQELNASGQLVDQSFNGPKIAELNTNLSTSYTLPYRIFVTAYVSHQEEFIGANSVGATAFGGNASYGFGKFMKGLTITLGMHDAASQVGNTGAGLLASASYNRNAGAWRLSANANYSQGIATLLAVSTESTGSASVSIRRNLLDRISFGANAGIGRSLFTNVNGQSTETKNAGVNLGWMKQTFNASYADSSGSAIITSQGLVPVPVPGLPSKSVENFSGKSYTAGYANTLIKNLSLNFGWGRFMSSGTGTGLFSNVSSENYHGGMIYSYRKIQFIANFAHSKQGASTTTALPSDINVFYFGLSRWFNVF